jgi:hypothetical protein
MQQKSAQPPNKPKLGLVQIVRNSALDDSSVDGIAPAVPSSSQAPGEA